MADTEGGEVKNTETLPSAKWGNLKWFLTKFGVIGFPIFCFLYLVFVALLVAAMSWFMMLDQTGRNLVYGFSFLLALIFSRDFRMGVFRLLVLVVYVAIVLAILVWTVYMIANGSIAVAIVAGAYLIALGIAKGRGLN